MRLLLATTALSLGLATAASAQEVSFGAGVSTLGPVIEGTVNVGDGFALRGIGFIPVNLSFNNIDVGSGYELDGTVGLGSGALLAEYYPFGQGFRLSGGIFIGQKEIATGNFIGVQNFAGALELDNEIAPMLSIGYRYDFASGWYLSGDVGAVITGFTATTNSTNAAVLSDLADINNSLDDIPAYPYVAISFGFTF